MTVAATAVLALAAGALVAVAAVVVRRPLPDHAGSVEVPGLSAQVSVLRDAQGVPTIRAQALTDLYLAQGYVDAQDRFFQMDLRRRVASGELAALVGPADGALDSDALMRTLGLRDVAQAEWELVDRSTRAALQAYADGVNAYLDGRSPEQLAVEYTVLGLSGDVPAVDAWTPVDSLAWLKLMAWELRANDQDEVARAQSWSTVRDVARVAELFPTAALGPPVVPATDQVELSADVVRGAGPETASTLDPATLAALDRATDAIASVPTLVGAGEGTGSSSWVVSGEQTTSGAPVLAVDPHLTLTAPGVWSQVGLRCVEVGEQCPVDATGLSLAGFPGVLIGRTGEVAWSLTGSQVDVVDLFVERTRPDEGTVLYEGEQQPLTVRTETIEISGAEPVDIDVRATLHGPIVSSVLDVAGVTTSPMPEGARGTEVALAWTGLQPGLAAQGLLALGEATSVADLFAAADRLDVPGQNLLVASADGTIGARTVGQVPLRERVVDGPVPSDGTWPRPGWDPRYDWVGLVEASELPQVIDPPTGYLVAANQAVTPVGTGPALGQDWDAGYRAARIAAWLDERASGGDLVDVAATARLQADVVSPLAEILVPALLAAPVEDAFTAQAVDLLAQWDGRATADSAAAAYLAAVWDDLLSATFADDLPQSQWPTGGSRWLAVTAAVLADPASQWWDDRTTVNVVESRDEILVRTLTAARLELTVALGKDPRDWEWGMLHRVAPEHPVLGGEGANDLVRRLVDPAPVAVDGGPLEVSATAWDTSSGSFGVTTGPSARLVIDLGEPDAATWVVPAGTSGHPGSVHYTDQLAAWASGEQLPWPFTATAVDDATTRTLTLRPTAG